MKLGVRPYLGKLRSSRIDLFKRAHAIKNFRLPGGPSLKRAFLWPLRGHDGHGEIEYLLQGPQTLQFPMQKLRISTTAVFTLLNRMQIFCNFRKHYNFQYKTMGDGVWKRQPLFRNHLPRRCRNKVNDFQENRIISK